MKWHIYSELFPMLDDGDLQKLADDIAANGQHEPVIVDEKGLILDGRNRSAACTLAGITPTTRVFKGDDAEKLAYVLSLNLHRRHLDTAQRAMVADKLAGLSKGQTKADSGIPLSQPTQADAATMLNVSVDSVKKARKIRKEASPEVVAQVERGELSLNAADATVKPKATKPADKKIGSASRCLLFSGDNIDVEVVIDDQPVTVPTKPASPQQATTTKLEPEAEKKSPSIIEIERSLFKMGKDKKRHYQLIQIAKSALSRLTPDEHVDVLVSQLQRIVPLQRAQVIDRLKASTT